MNTTSDQADPPDTRGTVPRRSMKTSRWVLFSDKLADSVITVGGLTVIVAVLGIMLFLVSVVVPLFTGASVTPPLSYDLPAGSKVLATTVDDYNTVAAEITTSGTVITYHLASGKQLQSVSADFAGQEVTAFARTLSGRDLAFGLGDGSIRFATLALRTEVLPADQMPPGLTRLNARDYTDGQNVYSLIPGEQVRRIGAVFKVEDAQKVSEAGSPIRSIDYRLGGTVERPTRAFVTLDEAGMVRLSLAETRINLLTRKPTTKIETADLPGVGDVKVSHVLLTQKADQVYMAGEDGTVLRYDTRDFTQPVLAERTSVMPAGIRLNDIKFLIGEQSIVTAGSDGSVAVHFRLNRGSKTTRDGFALVTAHVLEKQPAGVVHITASERGKTFATADAAGNVWIRHATSEQVLARLSQTMAEGESFGALVMSPRDDGLLSVTSRRRATFWGMHIPHPESTLKTIFGKVWYEGYPEPGHTWQSSAGTDAFEPKLSLMPLIFGSIKATVYSLLFAVPLALLGAIYTSEFCHPRVRAVVKPAMELMASLPSVVLGFIAALVLAPVVETWLSAVFLGLVLLPLFLLMSAYAWQLVPRHVAQHYAGLPKLLLVTLTLLVAVAAASTFAPGFESLLFGGDVKSWANGRTGSGIPLTAAVALPVSYLLVSFAFDRMAPRFVPAGAEMKAGLRSGMRWIILVLGSAATAFGLAWGLNAIGFESRGGIIDTYVQRNTMVVGFAMGFAVIPLIYTLAEDALNAVPEHLRAASLACGGTPWQTAIWVILPAAVSGVFAAVMVGMGRAVGETMIVVMAAGNTPLIDWNIFNGLRALSANIAVELPEAVKDGTLYRVLFLAALTLFVITFLINTAAEIIRQRFRRKAVQL